jgi:competence protein ComGC
LKQKSKTYYVKLNAFTLVELLVVISGITLLLSISLPALQKAKAAAYLAVCQSQLHQWGLSFENYSIENKGYYPHIDSRERGDFPIDNFGWVDMLPPLMGLKSWYEYPIWHRPTNGIYQCPIAKLGSSDPSCTYGYNPQRNGYFSYAMNSCLELDSGCRTPYGQTTGNNMPSFLNTASIKSPSRVILLFDQLLDPAKGYDDTQCYGDAGEHCGSYPKSFSERHYRKRGKLGGSIMYCDYHVEWVETIWNKNWPEGMKNDNEQAPPRDDLDWYPY